MGGALGAKLETGPTGGKGALELAHQLGTSGSPFRGSYNFV